MGALKIVKTADKTTVKHGDSIVYTLAVTYSSADRAPARNVVVTDSLCTTLTGPVKTGGNNNDLLNTRETWTYKCTYAVPRHTNGETNPIRNRARVNGNFDGTPLAQARSNRVSVDVVHSADLRVRKFGPPSVDAGKKLTYTIRVENRGPHAAEGVKVVDRLPAGTKYVSASGNGWVCGTNTPNTKVTCRRNRELAAGESTRLITLIVRVDRDRTADIENTAVVSSATPDPILRQ